MKILNNNIGSGRTFIIAEIGNNHNGNVETAKDLIMASKEAGVDCVKFQMRNIDKVYRKKSLDRAGDDLGVEYVLDLLDKFELKENQHRALADFCKQNEILYLCTPWDYKSVRVLEDMDVAAYKIASADLTNMPLIDCVARTHKPLILSTGMSTTQEVEHTCNFLKKRSSEFALLHCNSTYPAPLHDINLNWMRSLKDLHPIVGYSGHERGINVSLAAVALGASIIERHVTFDRTQEGPDHAASLLPDEFLELCKGIREIEQALGEGDIRELSQGELINRDNLSKSLVASGSLTKGATLRAEDIKVRSPGQGLSVQRYDDLIGRVITRDMEDEDYFYLSDLEEVRIEPRKYNFQRPWGIPVRYHDFDKFNDKVKPDIFEFHLSYSDLDLDINNFLKGTYDCGFVVHAPELFSDSHLMDLASEDPEYRDRSITETQRVINITRKLNEHFPLTKNPLIIANIGGFTLDEPLSEVQRQKRYEIFANSLNELDRQHVEIIPQTMAPFPWHFGGQRFQNLFVQADEIIEWCENLNLRLCFDISHSKLMCNHFDVDFYNFSEQIGNYTAHLHLGDAKGVNGEGLQISSGDIDFDKLSRILNENCPQASFIPEIWQGHKNGGEGFWIALDRLSGRL